MDAAAGGPVGTLPVESMHRLLVVPHDEFTGPPPRDADIAMNCTSGASLFARLPPRGYRLGDVSRARGRIEAVWSAAARQLRQRMCIIVEHASKCFGRLRAVDDISLDVRSGEIFAFLGPNGAGKTTTIKLIVGLMRPDAGRIQVCGHDMACDGRRAKAQLAYVPDEPFLYEKLTAREFLEFVAEMYAMDRREARQLIQYYMDRLQVSEFADQIAEGFSHGMKQRTVLAAALLHEPTVLVVDEPMVGLDPRSVRTVKELFREKASQGRTVFMSTHTLDVAESIADRIAIINHGRIIACGTLQALRSAATRERRLEDIFLDLTSPELAASQRPQRLTDAEAGPAGASHASDG